MERQEMKVTIHRKVQLNSGQLVYSSKPLRRLPSMEKSFVWQNALELFAFLEFHFFATLPVTPLLTEKIIKYTRKIFAALADGTSKKSPSHETVQSWMGGSPQTTKNWLHSKKSIPGAAGVKVALAEALVDVGRRGVVGVNGAAGYFQLRQFFLRRFTL
jgi:hypothetical protein